LVDTARMSGRELTRNEACDSLGIASKSKQTEAEPARRESVKQRLRALRNDIQKFVDGPSKYLQLRSDVPQEMALAYLRRSGFQMHRTTHARVYSSDQDQQVYERITATRSFDSSGKRAPKMIELFLPPYHVPLLDQPSLKLIEEGEIAALVGDQFLSITNPVTLDPHRGLVAWKLFTDETLATMTRSARSISDLNGSPSKAQNEAEQLAMMRRLAVEIPGLYIPEVYAQAGAVMAMEYVPGELLSEITSRGALGQRHIEAIAAIHAAIHAGLNAMDSKEPFTAPLGHSANTITAFKRTHEMVSAEDWDCNITADDKERYLQLCDKAGHLLRINPQFEDSKETIYGDGKDENIILMPDGRICLLDPTFCEGRVSMDMAKFLRSIVFKHPSTFVQYAETYIRSYESESNSSVDRKELLAMLGCDMLNILRSYITLPTESLTRFPSFIAEVVQHLSTYLDYIDLFLNGEFPV